MGPLPGSEKRWALNAVFDERIKVIVSSCGLDSYLDYYGGHPNL